MILDAPSLRLVQIGDCEAHVPLSLCHGVLGMKCQICLKHSAAILPVERKMSMLIPMVCSLLPGAKILPCSKLTYTLVGWKMSLHH